MRLLFLAFLLAALGSLQAQTVDGVDVTDIQVKYIEVQIINYRSGPEVSARVDYGQNFSTGKSMLRQWHLLDTTGEKMVFFSPIGVLNYFAGLGYEVAQVYPAPIYNAMTVQYYHYLLCRS